MIADVGGRLCNGVDFGNVQAPPQLHPPHHRPTHNLPTPRLLHPLTPPLRRRFPPPHNNPRLALLGSESHPQQPRAEPESRREDHPYGYCVAGAGVRAGDAGGDVEGEGFEYDADV